MKIHHRVCIVLKDTNSVQQIQVFYVYFTLDSVILVHSDMQISNIQTNFLAVLYFRADYKRFRKIQKMFRTNSAFGFEQTKYSNIRFEITNTYKIRTKDYLLNSN